MKLLLDENLSRRIVPFIQDSYPGSTQETLIGLEHVNDRVIRQYAIENDYVIITHNQPSSHAPAWEFIRQRSSVA